MKLVAILSALLLSACCGNGGVYHGNSEGYGYAEPAIGEPETYTPEVVEPPEDPGTSRPNIGKSKQGCNGQGCEPSTGRGASERHEKSRKDKD